MCSRLTWGLIQYLRRLYGICDDWSVFSQGSSGIYVILSRFHGYPSVFIGSPREFQGCSSDFIGIHRDSSGFHRDSSGFIGIHRDSSGFHRDAIGIHWVLWGIKGN